MSTNLPTLHFPDETPAKIQLPFVDEICGQIVRELEKRNWDVPGISCEFHTAGSGEDKHRVPSVIKGDSFMLHFTPRRRSWCTVSRVIVSKFELYLQQSIEGDDLDKLKLYVYTGSKQSRRLCYVGRFINAGQHSQYLYHDDGCNRRDSLKSGDSVRYETKEALKNIERLLKTEVFQAILDYPLPRQRIDIFYEEPVAFPETIGPLYCFGTLADAESIAQGKAKIEALAPADRYGFAGSDTVRAAGDGDGRLRTPHLTFDTIPYKPYGVGVVTDANSPSEIAIVGHDDREREENFVFRVVPKYANGIYVTDQTPYIATCTAIYGDNFKDFDPKTSPSKLPYRTIVPISTYTGGFTQPVVLMGRELDLNEVELVSGPWPGYGLATQIGQYSEEAGQLFQTAVELYSHKTISQGCIEYSDALVALVAVCQGNKQLVGLGLRSICGVEALIRDMVVARSVGLF